MNPLKFSVSIILELQIVSVVWQFGQASLIGKKADRDWDRGPTAKRDPPDAKDLSKKSIRSRKRQSPSPPNCMPFKHTKSEIHELAKDILNRMTLDVEPEYRRIAAEPGRPWGSGVPRRGPANCEK
jgi:hypothetical protein